MKSTVQSQCYSYYVFPVFFFSVTPSPSSPYFLTSHPPFLLCGRSLFLASGPRNADLFEVSLGTLLEKLLFFRGVFSFRHGHRQMQAFCPWSQSFPYGLLRFTPPTFCYILSCWPVFYVAENPVTLTRPPIVPPRVGRSKVHPPPRS